MHRDADGSGLIRNGSGDGLTDPPCRVGGKLITFAVIKLLHRLDQSQITLLDQIKKEHTSPHVTLGNADHQPEIGLRKTLLRLQIARLHLLCQLDLLLRRKQRHLADLFQIHPDGIFNADAVRHGEIDVLHIHFVLLCEDDLLIIHIVLFCDAQHIYIILFKRLQNFVKLILLRRKIGEEIVNLLIFQHVFFLLRNSQKLLQTLLKLCLYIFFHELLHPSYVETPFVNPL